VQQLKTLIETDATAYMVFTQMFDQVPARRKTSPSGLPQVRDYEHMLRLFNVIMTEAHLRAMLNEWAVFLRPPQSTQVLNDKPPSGWFCPDALKHMPHFAVDIANRYSAGAVFEALEMARATRDRLMTELTQSG